MSESLSRKERDEKIITARYIYTAFFYSEYVLRHYETQRPCILEQVNIILNFIKRRYKCNLDKATEILDRLMEIKAGSDDIHFKCSISKNSLIKRHIKKRINLNLRDKDFLLLYEDFIFNDLELDLNKIIQISLEEGVYLSHLPTYRTLDYDFNIFNIDNKEYLTRHIFYKNDFLLCGNSPYIKIYSNKNLTTGTPIDQNNKLHDLILDDLYNLNDELYNEQQDDVLDDVQDEIYNKEIDLMSYIDNVFNTENQNQYLHFGLDINPKHKEFSIKNSLQYIHSVLLAHLYTEIYDSSKYDTVSSTIFMKKFFIETIHKSNTTELQNRLIGLLIWDIEHFEKKRKNCIFYIYRRFFKKI